MTDAPAPTTVICPRGHELQSDQVAVRDGYRVCPVCESETPWAEGPSRPLPWSRKLLRAPLMVLAAGLLVGAVAGAFHVAESISYVDNHLPGATASLIGSIVDMLGSLILATGVAWVATLVGSRE